MQQQLLLLLSPQMVLMLPHARATCERTCMALADILHTLRDPVKAASFVRHLVVKQIKRSLP